MTDSNPRARLWSAHRRSRNAAFRALAALACLAALGGAADAGADPYERRTPLLPERRDWPVGDTWKSRKVGERDFYFVENGPYMRARSFQDPALHRALYETGVLQRSIPGYLPNRYLGWFGDPTGASPGERYVIDQFIANRWPIWSISYVTARGLPLPNRKAFEVMGDRWIGDGSTEYMTYRLEGVMGYLRSGKLGSFSSSGDTESDAWSEFMERKLVPELRRVLPRALDNRKRWTNHDARTLSDAFMRTYFDKIGKAVAWGVYLSPYTIALMPGNMAVGQRNSNPLFTAHARGIMRSAGGNKFFLSWQTGEEAARWMGHNSGGGVVSPEYESYGYDLEHVRNMMWRPFLTGAQYFIFHPAPMGFIADVEQDGHHELTAIGETFHDIVDMSEALPDRGVAYAAVGLLLDGDHNFAAHQHRPTTAYLGLKTDFEAADAMIDGLLYHLFPVHPSTAGYGLPNRTAPYGEIFDILSPNQRGAAIRPEVFESYPVLFDLGGLRVDAEYAQVLTDYVRNGGTLVISAADLGAHLAPALFGVALAGAPRTGERVVSLRDGRKFAERKFSYRPLKLAGAEAIYTVDGQPLVTLNRVGSGHAILVAADFLIQDEVVSDRRSPAGPPFANRPLLKMVPHFLDQLAAGTMPIELRCAPEDREHLTWWVHKRADSWLVFVQNYDKEKRFEPDEGTLYTVLGDYEFEPIEFELVSRVPTADVVDLYGRRNIPFSTEGQHVVARDSVRYGDIRIYEFSAAPIELARTRFVDYAQGAPVRASRTLEIPTHRPKPTDPRTERYAPQFAVDGVFDNRRYWQSGRGTDPRDYDTWNSLPLPAWLEVDLERTRRLDHVTLQFHHRPLRDSIDMMPRIIRYRVEVSKNRRSWTTVIDESQNAKPLRPRPVTKWFDPIDARYARLTVLSNSERRGAQVVEFAVYGEEREPFVAERLSPWRPQRAWLPIDVQNWPASRQIFLTDRDPLSLRNKRGGSEFVRFDQKAIHTMDHASWGGHVYRNVVDVSAPHEMSFAVPERARRFAAVGGFQRMYVDRSGVAYRVYVDGEKRFDSGPYHGYAALPIVVDVGGAARLRIVVEDLHDGKLSHDAVLAEPRFLLD